jgi:hypothetical protein
MTMALRMRSMTLERTAQFGITQPAPGFLLPHRFCENAVPTFSHDALGRSHG